MFLVESISVVLQVSYFKYTKRKFGEGKRIFLMSPLHHHYQKLGYNESKIVTRFWIVTILCVVFAIVTFENKIGQYEMITEKPIRPSVKPCYNIIVVQYLSMLLKNPDPPFLRMTVNG